MRFYFDIDAEELNDEYSPSFIELIKMRCADGLREEVWDSITRDGTYETLIDDMKRLIKDHQQEIIDAVVEKVSDKIAAKKQLLEITPKASQFAAADKESVAYFEEMVDRAIARRFGK